MGPPAAFGVARLTADPSDPSTIYAESGAAGLWKSRDGGETWSAADGGLPASPASFAAHPSSPGVLFAGLIMPQVTAPGLWRSTDGGATWKEIAEAPAFGALPHSEVVVTSSGLLYWVESGTPYRSPDGGSSWECMAPPVACIPNPEVEAFAVAPSNPSALYALVATGLLRSDDAGSSWEGPLAVTPFSPAAGIRPDRIVVSAENPAVLFAWRSTGADAGAGSPCFARSDDGGHTWRGFLDDRQCGAPALDPRRPGTVHLLVGTDRRVQESRDGGETWQDVGQAPVEGRLLADPIDPEGLFLSGSDRLLRSRDGGRTWAPVRGGLETAGVQLLEPSPERPGTLFATFSPPAPKPPSDNRSWRMLRKTTDLGRTWTELPLARVTALGIDPHDPAHLLAARLAFQGATVSSMISESRDGGQSWQDVLVGSLPRITGLQGEPVISRLSFDPARPQSVLAATFAAGVLASDDGGRTWRGANHGLPVRRSCAGTSCPTNEASALVRDPLDPRIVYVLFERSAYRSEDRGESWQQAGRGLPAGALTALAADASKGGTLYASSAPNPLHPQEPGAVFRSANRGRTWIRLAKLPKVLRLDETWMPAPVRDLAVSHAGLFVAADGVGVLRSTDGGATWSPVAQGLFFPDVTRLAVDPLLPGRLFAATPANGAFTIRLP
jgi:photosystem II stability/assembly factor-like uncharacterized protein